MLDKYKYRFFSFDLSEVQDDVLFILKRHFNNKNVDIKKLEDNIEHNKNLSGEKINQIKDKGK